MTPSDVMSIAQHALWVTLWLLIVTLLPVLVVGLLVSLFQAATQINEMTLSFVPKLFVMCAAFALGGPWMLRLLVEYTRELLEQIPYLIG